MMLVTISYAPKASTPEECTDADPLLVAQVDRATCEAILAVVARAISDSVEADAAVAEWEPDPGDLPGKGDE